jgi:threonine/homoserine/homoserine lactone efflux protein
VFFASVLPQFAPEGQGMFSGLVLLGVVFAALTFVWLAAYAVVIALTGDLFRRSSIRRRIEALTGAVLIALGVRIAADSR